MGFILYNKHWYGFIQQDKKKRHVKTDLDKISKEIRKKLVMMHRSGPHFGAALSIVDILTVLYFKIMKIKSPEDPDRDRFILSKGHAASAWYATLARKGFVEESVLDGYLAGASKLCGHPVRGNIPGLEASTGSLGHGLAIGTGMALAARNDAKSYRTYVLMGDGEIQEGSVWEAAVLACRLKLDNLVAIIDANDLQGFDRVENIQPIDTFSGKWEAFGWGVREVDGHDHRMLEKTFRQIPFTKEKPSLIIARTVKGKGIPEMEGKFESHYFSVKPEQVDRFLKALDDENI